MDMGQFFFGIVIPGGLVAWVAINVAVIKKERRRRQEKLHSAILQAKFKSEKRRD
jgi:hypothetical protein